MCGFVGFANLKENISSKTNIYNMNESISKRGPDEDGYYYEEHVCLGHKRLIVVDPDGGKQPMSAMKDGNLYTIVYNGVVLEVVKEQRYGEDDEKRRKYGSQCSDYAPSYSP